MTTLATTNDHASLGNPYDAGCPTRHILDRIGDRWTVLIIGALGAGTLRFNELRRRVEELTAKLPSQEQPKGTSVLTEEFTMDNGLLTPTLKVKRREVEARFKAMVDDMYARLEKLRKSDQ